MTIARPDRRRGEDGSLICENGHLRLRVVRDGRSLGLIIDTIGIDMQWGSLGFMSSGEDIVGLDAGGASLAGCFFSFDPLDVAGQTRGVVLHGQIGNARMMLTATLDETSTWCRLRLEIAGMLQVERLIQEWRLLPGDIPPEICWPPALLQGNALAFSPAAFLQDGPIFAGLVADLTDEDPNHFSLEVSVPDPTRFEFGLNTNGVLAAPFDLSYALGLDARTLPERGFQQVVRLLGSQSNLSMVGRCQAKPISATLPALQDSADAKDWHLFVWEGAPEAIAALVRSKFARVEDGDWHALEDGLCWLDRLCLQQCPFGIPKESSLGAFGPGEEWEPVAVWMPILLMQAFRLTGSPEYAYRAQAALNALPPMAQGIVLGQLRPTFGDLYVQADYQALVSLSGPEITSALFTADSLEITVASGLDALRLVLDGSDEAYVLTINGRRIGPFAAEELSAGIELDFA